jgi:hypothetical protein
MKLSNICFLNVGTPNLFGVPSQIAFNITTPCSVDNLRWVVKSVWGKAEKTSTSGCFSVLLGNMTK